MGWARHTSKLNRAEGTDEGSAESTDEGSAEGPFAPAQDAEPEGVPLDVARDDSEESGAAAARNDSEESDAGAAEGAAGAAKGSAEGADEGSAEESGFLAVHRAWYTFKIKTKQEIV